jgi:hypothetical protein
VRVLRRVAVDDEDVGVEDGESRPTASMLGPPAICSRCRRCDDEHLGARVGDALVDHPGQAVALTGDDDEHAGGYVVGHDFLLSSGVATSFTAASESRLRAV